MANRISMVKMHEIVTLCKHGFSQREVARKLAVHRHTVSRYVHLAEEASKSTIPPAGSEGAEGAKSTISPAGSAGRKSQCEPWRPVIEAKLQTGLSAQRIYQDLVTEQGFAGSYDSVKRFVRRLGSATPLPFRRMECAPGQEAQVDFGKGAPVEQVSGRRKRPHLFRLVLSYSRKGYTEVVWRQDTETFIRCLENAFRQLGGVPKTLVIDNLKAGVIQADWYDPELNPKLQSFCSHYGTVILPTKPYTPRHKGKSESDIKYVQNNAIKGHDFTGLTPHNQHLAYWEEHVADTRIHGTTRKQVGKVFAEVERAALLPLPPNLFPSFREAQRVVHRDGHVEVEKAYYSVPPEYVTRTVWVRYDGRMVRVFNVRMEPIAVHAQVEAGRFQTRREHVDPRKISGVERGTGWLLQRARLIGSQTERWAQAMLEARGLPGIRVLVGLLSLAGRYPHVELERSCGIALSHGAFRLRTLRELIKRGGSSQEEFVFMDRHPIIRNLSDYEAVVRAALR